MGGSESKPTVSESKYSENTTSVEVMKDFGESAKGRSVIVTGGNCGLGFETCRALAEYGASVVIACRNPQLGQEAVDKIKAQHPEADISTLALDLASFASIDQFVEAYLALQKPLHLLINNAGVMACPKSFTKDGHELQLGVNHFGHFRLTMKLIDLLKSSSTTANPSRVVNVSSAAHYAFAPKDTPIRFDDLKAEQSYDPMERYGSSKIANIYFTEKLSEKYSKDTTHPIICVAIHPGAIKDTNLSRHLGVGVIAGVLFNALLEGRLYDVAFGKFKTLQEGAATQLFVAMAPPDHEEIVSGEYYANCAIERVKRHPKIADQHYIDELWKVSWELNQMKEE
jgi:NAD(P)-dependent dehydrogenase (short-subunit alcohol dehydrogenase family)